MDSSSGLQQINWSETDMWGWVTVQQVIINNYRLNKVLVLRYELHARQRQEPGNACILHKYTTDIEHG